MGVDAACKPALSRKRSGLEGAFGRWLLPVLAVILAAGLLIGKHTANWVWAAAGLAVAGAGIAVFRKQPTRRRILITMLTLCAGVVLGTMTWHPILPEERVWHVTGVIAEEVRDGHSTQHRTVLQHVTLDGKPWRGGAYWSFYMAETPEDLQPGVRVEGDFRLYHPSGAENPGGFDFREYLLQRNIRIGLYGSTGLTIRGESNTVTGRLAALRHVLTGKLYEVMGEQAGSYAATMLLGVRSLLPTEERDAFSRLGIAHILSVSGFHVAVLYGIIAQCLHLLRLSRKVRLPILTMLLTAYCILAGLGAPVVRASILILLREYGLIRHRPSEGLHLLSCAAIITLLLMPAQVTNAGFHLSYAALLALILVRPFLAGKSKEDGFLARHRRMDRLHNMLMSSLAVQIGILLPQLYWYQELPLLSVLLNILVLALAACLLNLYWILLVLMWVPFIGPSLGRLAAWITDLMTRGVMWLGSADWITLWTKQADLITLIGWLLVGVGLCYPLCLKKWIRLALTTAGTAAIVLSVVPWPHHGTEYIQLSVGNADAAVLQDEQTVWAVDTGEDATLSTYLHQRRLSVDTLVITHLHADHVGGITELINDRIPIRRVILPASAEQLSIAPESLGIVTALEKRGIEVIHAGRGDVFTLPSGTMTVLWPEKEHVRRNQDPNDYSLAMLFELNGVRMLTTGDLTGTYEMYSAQPADLLKAAHHGSSSSTSPEYLSVVSPGAILVSGNDETRWAALIRRSGGIPVWGTQDRGAIMIRFDENKAFIDGYHEPVLSPVE